MKYIEIGLDEARECCKKYRQYNKTYNKYVSMCEKCPLRRTRVTKGGQEITLVCCFKLLDIEKELAEEYIELSNEQIHHEDEWIKYLESEE